MVSTDPVCIIWHKVLNFEQKKKENKDMHLKEQK